MDSAASDHASRSRLTVHFPFIILLAVFAALAFVVATDLNLYTPDSTRYLVWAKSLSAFEGFRDDTSPDPVRYVVHAPLYPVLLVPGVWISGQGILASKITTMLFGLTALTLFYRWLSPRTGSALAAVAGALLAFNPMVLLFSTEVLSDIPFAAACIAILIAAEKIRPDDGSSVRSLLIPALLTTAGILVREVGFSLLVGMTVYFLFRRQWRACLVVIGIPVVVYALWYVRNELLVAGVELPPLTNAKLMLAHFYTLPDANIVQEWSSRCAVNAATYGSMIAKLLFFPLHGWVQFDVVFIAAPPLTVVNGILEIAKYPVSVVSLAGVAFGAIHDFRSSPTALLRAVFLAAYVAAILLYPLNDLRFMLPVLIILMFYFALGIARALQSLRRRVVAAIGFICLFILCLPNLVWDAQYAENCAAYRASPLSFHASTTGLNKYPSHFTKPLRLVGEWFERNTDSAALVLTQWKDLTTWMAGRKAYPADQTISLAEFESAIRDYGVTHLVAVVQKNGAREFDVQMHATRRYLFAVKERIANVEMYEIRENESGRRTGDTSNPYRHGIFLLAEGSYERAEQILEGARAHDSLNMPLLFASAVAKEFSMKLEEARERFIALSSMPQSLMYAEEAGLHRQMIERLIIARAAAMPTENADAYTRVASICWNAGYRVRARELLSLSLEQDSAFFPAMIFGIYFSVAERDTAHAARLFLSASRLDSANPVIIGYRSILARFDSLRRSKTHISRAQLFNGIAATYRGLGIMDGAIDNALLAFREDSTDVAAALSLAEMYEAKRKWSPARAVLSRIARVYPANEVVRARLATLEARF